MGVPLSLRIDAYSDLIPMNRGIGASRMSSKVLGREGMKTCHHVKGSNKAFARYLDQGYRGEITYIVEVSI